MITFLRGVLVDLHPSRLVLDVAGVGYEVLVPMGCFDLGAELGKELRVLIHHHQTEAAQTLFGFKRGEQRDLFRLMVERVSGVGPKVALAVLGGMGLEEFRRCVVEQDAKALATVKGVGPKTAQRILLELKDKVGLADAFATGTTGAAGAGDGVPDGLRTTVLALLALGYKQAAADKAARAASEQLPQGDEGELLRAALRWLR